ncbi:hypothetical protein LCGC14_0359390 [marine sediment metagenome]|uniref:Uncharacterized protein n=1 Tax=marine sediment metagenome TaxID=412755 RepID=A0A0F9TE79_9ZZZZ
MIASNRIDSFTYRDSAAAFDQAIKTGRLSTVQNTANYAGDYMYMHTDRSW